MPFFNGFLLDQVWVIHAKLERRPATAQARRRDWSDSRLSLSYGERTVLNAVKLSVPAHSSFALHRGRKAKEAGLRSQFYLTLHDMYAYDHSTGEFFRPLMRDQDGPKRLVRPTATDTPSIDSS